MPVPVPGPAPSEAGAEQANELIRAFMRARLGRPLLPHEQSEYTALLELWVAALRSGHAEQA